MEEAFLRFIATEDDLNRLLSRWLTPPSKLRDLSIEVIPDELLLRGVYETILRVPFKCFWKISVFDRRMVAELSNIKCVGVRLNLLKPYVLNELVSNCNVLERRGESVFLDLDRLLAQMIVPIRTNLTSVRCGTGQLVIECGNIQ
jgi:hypothetical protein